MRLSAILLSQVLEFDVNVPRFGRGITLDPYIDQFLSVEEGAPRAAVKRLTRTIETRLIELTINAPDWQVLFIHGSDVSHRCFSHTGTHCMLHAWQGTFSGRTRPPSVVTISSKFHKRLSLLLFPRTLMNLSLRLVDLFSTPDATPNFNSVKRHLLEYYSLLQSTQLTNSVLSALPLPDTLDPYRPVPLPSRLFTLLILLRDSLSCLVRLPLFIFPLMIHLPAYVMARLGARLVEDEEETQAQNKILFGLLLLVLIYPAAFFFLWAFLWYTPVGALFAGFVVWLTAIYHTKLVNGKYILISTCYTFLNKPVSYLLHFTQITTNSKSSFLRTRRRSAHSSPNSSAKRLVAAWRVLIGVWAPKRFEYPLTTLAQYTTTPIPPVNPWISGSHSGTSTPKPDEKAGTSATGAAAEPPVKSRRKRRPRSGRVMRHVLRARAEAVRALASFVDQLEKGPAEKCVNASAHLAWAYGGGVEDPSALESQSVESAVVPPRNSAGWRRAREVITFLRKRGAKITALERGIEADWAALNSDGEMSPSEDAEDAEDRDEIVFVSPGQ